MDLLHTLYEPPGDGPHPTILALHGWGASAMDLIGLAPYLAGGQFLVICPQGPIEVPLGPMVGHGWFPLTMGAPPDPREFANAVAAVRRFLDQAQRRYPLHPDKLVLLGFSQGGVIAYATALSEPQRFAGLVALSSWLPDAVAGSLPPMDRSRLSTLVHHGTQDDLIRVERGRESVERLRQLQVPVTYREFPMGHELNQQSLSDLSDWLSQKILSPILLAG
jgi:phospholipase/carboxylesterase